MDINKAKAKLQKTLNHIKEEYNKIRGGRINPKIIEDIKADAYGAKTPIQQMGTVSVVDSSLITVQCWDPNNAEAIKKAINESDLNVNASIDGSTIRVPLPPLTEERRKELVKVVKNLAEEAKLSVRMIRRDYLDALEKSGLSEDDVERGEKQIQELVDKTNKAIEDLFKEKKEQLMKI